MQNDYKTLQENDQPIWPCHRAPSKEIDLPTNRRNCQPLFTGTYCWVSRSTVAGLQVSRSRDGSCTLVTIHTKIHLISPGCVLQCKIVALNIIHVIYFIYVLLTIESLTLIIWVFYGFVLQHCGCPGCSVRRGSCHGEILHRWLSSWDYRAHKDKVSTILWKK